MFIKVLTCIATFLCIASCSENVPLFLWTNVRDMSCPQKPQGPGEIVSRVFSSSYVNCLASSKPDQIVVFVYDKLGIEDLSVYGQQDSGIIDPFSNVKKYTSEYPSLVIPSMQPFNLVEDLMSRFTEVFDSSNIKVINLPPIDRSTEASTASGLHELDEKLRDAVNKIKGKYIAVLTSEGSPVTFRNPSFLKNKRHLLAVRAYTPNVTLITDCVYMTFQSLNVTVTPRSSNAKPISSEFTYVTHEGVCQISNTTKPSNASLSLTFNANEHEGYFGKVNIDMTFQKKFYQVSARDWWVLTSVVLHYNDTTSTLYPRGVREVNAPAGFSYVCSSTDSLSYYDYRTGNHLNNTVDVRFVNWQVQPFDVKNNTFGQASDCVGWYTGPIWSGLLVSIILILIFFYGLGMSASVTTMDRFDNPKGKTIIVPQDN